MSKPDTHTATTTPTSTAALATATGTGSGAETTSKKPMCAVKPFVPTAEELAIYDAHRAREAAAAARKAAMAARPASTAPLTVLSPSEYVYGPAVAPVAAPAPTEPPPPPDLKSCLLTASHLAGLSLPRRPYLLDRWLCQGDLAYIFAPRGVGKTWMAMALPLALSLGRPLGKWKAGGDPTPGENGANSTKPRRAPLRGALGLATHVAEGWGRPAGDVAGHPRPRRACARQRQHRCPLWQTLVDLRAARRRAFSHRAAARGPARG